MLLKPCFQISNVIFKSFPIALPDQMNPGEVLLVDLSYTRPDRTVRLPYFSLLPSTATIESLAINKATLTHWKHNLWMGSVGIPKISDRPAIAEKAPYPVVTLVGLAPIKNGHAFQNPEQIIYKHDIIVNLKPLTDSIQIRLPTSVQERLKKDEALLEAERFEMRTLLTKVDRPWNLECWQKPLHSRKVSDFASPRTLPDGRQYYHSGLDLRAGIGTTLKAAANGVIVYSGHMTVPGELIVIDHGGGLFSRYLHMEKRDLEVGTQVTKGQKIGLSGATGRVEAPHLHWEIVWKGIPVDPESFLQAVEQTCDPA